jgi:hypothetical protein
MGNNAVLMIHRLNGHKLRLALVLKNIGIQEITPDTEKMAESSCQIKTPNVRQSYRFNISKGGANIRGMRE